MKYSILILRNMKLIVLLLFSDMLLLLENSCLSTKNIEPIWLHDKESVFPSKNYIAALGKGKTEEDTKNNAIFEVSRYLRTTVDSTIQTNFHSESNNGTSIQKHEIIKIINVSSNSTLSGFSFTNPYYNKKEKCFYCVAYSSRENAWKQYQPEIEQAKHEFYAIYDKIPMENPIRAIAWKQKIQESSNTFLEKLIFSAVIDSDKANSMYSSDRQNIASILEKLNTLKEELFIYIDSKNDTSNFIKASLKNTLSTLGFQIKETKKGARYILKSEITFDQTKSFFDGDVIFTLIPIISITIFDSTDTYYNNSFYSKKIVSFSETDAQEKALKIINEIIKKELKTDLTIKLIEKIN